MDKKIVLVKCPYCLSTNRQKYLGNEKPKKFRMQCRLCNVRIKYERPNEKS
jgi:hypothetical protein